MLKLWPDQPIFLALDTLRPAGIVGGDRADQARLSVQEDCASLIGADCARIYGGGF